MSFKIEFNQTDFSKVKVHVLPTFPWRVSFFISMAAIIVLSTRRGMLSEHRQFIKYHHNGFFILKLKLRIEINIAKLGKAKP